MLCVVLCVYAILECIISLFGFMLCVVLCVYAILECIISLFGETLLHDMVSATWPDRRQLGRFSLWGIFLHSYVSLLTRLQGHPLKIIHSTTSFSKRVSSNLCCTICVSGTAKNLIILLAVPYCICPFVTNTKHYALIFSTLSTQADM